MQFDSQQEKVIRHTKGHALILAGAGSGKTSTATERAVQLIVNNHVAPQNILMMTFTNKAAREMRQRIFRRFDDMEIELEHQPTVTTFHAFGQKIINKNPEACGRQGIPSLMTDDDQGKLLTQSLRKYCNDFQAGIAESFYDKIRNIGLAAGFESDDEAIIAMLSQLSMQMANPIAWEPMLQGFIDYESEKTRLNALDYHDLLILPIHAIKRDNNLLLKFRKHILDLTVDEAQDTNIAQYELIKLIAPPDTTTQNVLMIGDEDQSIHRWRGANPDNLKVFNAEYQSTQYRMEYNYRSRPQIVMRADLVIKNNFNRFEKEGIPTRSLVENPTHYIPSGDANDMSACVAKSIKERIDSGIQPSDIAILYRTNRMANLLEPALLAEGIPYQIYNGNDLLSRSESKIILSAIRFAVNPRDTLAFEKLTELMPRVGQKLIDKMIDDIKPGETIFDVATRLPEAHQLLVVPMLKSILELRNSGPNYLLKWIESQPEIRNWLTKKAHAHLKTNKTNKPKEFDTWKKFNRNETLGDDEREMLKIKGVIDRCEKYQTKLNETIFNSIERMKLVLRSIKERIKEMPNASLNEQWYEANAVIAAPPDESKKKDSVNLMSIHSSKGLEWPIVYLVGMSEGIMPFGLDNSQEHMEDERRLAYVGITRARDYLEVHHCDRINLLDGKGYRYVKPSLFIEEAGFKADVDQKKIANNFNFEDANEEEFDRSFSANH